MIEFFYHVTVKAAFGGAFEFGGSINDRMHHCVGQVQDKGFFLIPPVLKIIDGLVRIESGKTRHVVCLACRCVVFMESNVSAIVGAKSPEVVIKPLRVGHTVNNRLAV